MKKALIVGVNGQDGSYLSELLLEKGYEVFGTIRRSSVFVTARIEHLFSNKKFHTTYGDLSDAANLLSIVNEIEPDEIYNLGAQSHVAVSFAMPEYTADVDAIGTTRLLTAIKNMKKPARFYQASTSELFGGLPGSVPQNENTPFHPKSPYGAAKLYAYWITVNYRQAYGLHASNGLLFNHESPRRGETFVTKKISKSVAKIAKGSSHKLSLGNLEAKRDWGYAKEYVDCMWKMLQMDEPEDLVVATGTTRTVKQFVEYCFEVIGREINWEGTGANAVGFDKKSGEILVNVDPRYYRPAEVEILQGDASRAKDKLGWSAITDVKCLAKMMVEYDLKYDSYGFPDPKIGI